MAVTEIVEPVCECIAADSRPSLIDGEKVAAAGGLGPLPPAPISPLAPAYYLGRPARVWHEALQPRRGVSVARRLAGWIARNASQASWTLSSVAVGDGVDTQRSPERILPVPSVTAPIRRVIPPPSDHRQPPLSVASPPFRLRGCWQRTIDGDGRESLVCRWILVPAWDAEPGDHLGAPSKRKDRIPQPFPPSQFVTIPNDRKQP
jgi:hypothetical protein